MRHVSCFPIALCAVLLCSSHVLASAPAQDTRSQPKETPRITGNDASTIPQPQPQPAEVRTKDRYTRNNTSQMVIEYDDKIDHAILRIPERFLVESDKKTAAAVSISDTNTIVAGLALCLSAMMAGLWLARRNRAVTARTAGAATLGVISVIAVATAWANLAPPPDIVARDPGNLPLALSREDMLIGGVEVVVVPDSESRSIELHLPRAKSGKTDE